MYTSNRFHDPVKWMKRCNNRVADGLADLTMDTRSTWHKRFDTTLAIDQANIIVQTDGGLREGDSAAAAWIIGLWGHDGGGYKYEPLIAHGTFLEADCTVFRAEAIDLDEACAEVQRLILSSFDPSQ